MSEILKKAIIYVGSKDEKLFPLTSAIPKELLPFGDVPAIHYLIEEVLSSNIKEVIFILPTEKKIIEDHFKNIVLRAKEDNELENKFSSIKFSYFLQKKNAKAFFSILRAGEYVGEEPFVLLFSNSIFFGEKHPVEQLHSLYRTSQKPAVSLIEISGDDISKHYVAETEKIANRIYKIKRVLKNPSVEETNSRFAIMPRYIFNPLFFDFIKKTGKQDFADILSEMLSSGKNIYGYEYRGRWLLLNNKEDYLTENLSILDKKFK